MCEGNSEATAVEKEIKYTTSGFRSFPPFLTSSDTFFLAIPDMS